MRWTGMQRGPLSEGLRLPQDIDGKREPWQCSGTEGKTGKKDTWGQVRVGQTVQPSWQFLECCHLFTEGPFDSTLSLIQGMVAHLRCLGADMHLL